MQHMMSYLLDRHKRSLRTEYGPTAEFLEIAEIVFVFNRSIRTGQWEAHVATSKKMLCLGPLHLAIRNMPSTCHFISVKCTYLKKNSCM